MTGLLITVLGFSAAVAVFLVVYLGVFVVEAKRRAGEREKVRKRRMLQGAEAALPLWFERWADQVETRIKRGHTGFKFTHYLIMMSVLMAVAFLVGLALLKNVVAFFILAITAAVIPEHVVRNQIHTRKNKLLQQLGPAIRLLAAEHSGTAQINRAFMRVATKLDQPLKGVFDRVVRNYLADVNQDQIYIQLLQELDFEYGKIFVQTLRVVDADAGMRHLLWWLAEQIASQIDDVLEEQSAVVSERLMSIAAVVAIFPVLFVMLKYVPETQPFLVEDPTGRAVISLCLASPLVNVLFDRLVNRS